MREEIRGIAADCSRECVGTANQQFRVTWPDTKLQFFGTADKDLCINTSGSECPRPFPVLLPAFSLVTRP